MKETGQTTETRGAFRYTYPEGSTAKYCSWWRSNHHSWTVSQNGDDFSCKCGATAVRIEPRVIRTATRTARGRA